jgi:hypothetical protein
MFVRAGFRFFSFMWADLPLIVIRAIDEEDAENAQEEHEEHHAEHIVPVGKLLHSLSNLNPKP